MSIVVTLVHGTYSWMASSDGYGYNTGERKTGQATGCGRKREDDYRICSRISEKSASPRGAAPTSLLAL